MAFCSVSSLTVTDFDVDCKKESQRCKRCWSRRYGRAPARRSPVGSGPHQPPCILEYSLSEAGSGRALELVQRTTHGGYTGASADNLMAVTYSGYIQRILIFAFIYLSHQWDAVLPIREEKINAPSGVTAGSRQYCRRRPLGGPRLSPGANQPLHVTVKM